MSSSLTVPATQILSPEEKKRKSYRRLIFLTWFLTLDLIMFGAFVRLTDSGLGCPDWPGCYGMVTPIGALADIRAAEQAMPDGPVTMPKAWIEMIHRYVGALLGLMMIGFTVLAWRWRNTIGRTPWLPTFTLLAVCIQGAFGAWTVTLKLMPIIVTIHLLGGMTLMALMTWLAAREKQHTPINPENRRYSPWVGFGLVLLFMQIGLGGWVSTNYAALACMDFPTCNGAWIPKMDLANGFSLVRGLGELPSGEAISQKALVGIHWVHRNFAWVIFAYLGTLAWRLRSDPGLRGPCHLIFALLFAQLITGLTTIFFQWPLLVSVLHIAGAAGLTIAVVTLLVRVYGIRPAKVSQAGMPQFA
uniref:COX15/CtaA family protein n=1 Tax=Orrella sp. TaxID=1921583 RepID=UPI004048E511